MLGLRKKLDEEQLDQLADTVKAQFMDEIGTLILRKHAEAFNKVIKEAAEEKLENQAAKLRKKMETQFSQWSQDQPLMRRMADCEIRMNNMENSQVAFQNKVESMIEAMLNKLDEIMEGQRPQPNAALQEIQDQLASFDIRLTRLELRGKSSQR